ncbi:MAG: aminotransferase class III-fold pyridoxal phosphate-dependent enzyme [Planctomycetota bacterium]|nr:MAG: aminotransferase class III-fold pyridoxal phosphate-dependent enzyme [Planctomycetota bacterium]
MTHLEMLSELRAFGGERLTEGLSDQVIDRFLALDPQLGAAIEEALAVHRSLRDEWGQALAGSEAGLARALQAGYLNFYEEHAINPYVPLAARGPWIVTAHGAVVHDSGGYGMLGLGHAPSATLDAMARPWVMANVMTPSFSQARLDRRLRAEVGHSRGGCPFAKFVCMNSGSEAVTVALRIADIGARRRTDPGGPDAGKAVVRVAVEGGFHGRTQRPALSSPSTRPVYAQHLATFRGADDLLTVPPNDVSALERVFAQAASSGCFVEALLLEPVMGEGNPGLAVSRGFYDRARELTRAHGSLLLVDSIQAGLRARGCLSIVDYPGFQDCEPPDMETYSKALNAGQYPLSVLALGERAASLYVRGVYGNTMTTNPRALEVACAVLDAVTPELRENVRVRGEELLARFRALCEEFPFATGCSGTGLLLALHLDPERAPVSGPGALEERCRRRGLGVIHGGRNALRFTPHFGLTAAEVDLIADELRAVLREHAG